MTQGPDEEIVGGERARAQVAADPFWSVVRRRHPDVDVVVLPPGDGAVPELPEDVVAVDPGEAAARADADVLARCRELVGQDPDGVEARWTAGEVRGTRRRETTHRVTGVDDVRAIGLLLRAEEALRSEGWHVLAPTDGVPRVLAGRPADLGREELQLLAPPGGGVVLRVRSGSVLLAEVAS